MCRRIIGAWINIDNEHKCYFIVGHEPFAMSHIGPFLLAFTFKGDYFLMNFTIEKCNSSGAYFFAIDVVNELLKRSKTSLG